jgi:LPXTG-motif cell wall-anchored protein
MKTSRSKKSALIQQFSRFQSGTALGLLGFAFLAGGLYLNAGASTTPTVSTCRPVAVRDIATANPAANEVAYTVTSLGQGKTATASVKAGVGCEGFTISLVSYKTPAANSLPYVKQTISDSQTKALVGTVSTLTVNVPDYYYQIDLAYGQPLDLATGRNYNTDHTLLWGAIGGTKACLASPTPTNTPVRTATPTATPMATVTPTATATPVATSTPSPTTTPKPTHTPGVGGGTPTPSPTPTVIPLGPGESTPPATTQTAIAAFLPQTGQAGSLMTLLGALLITVGLFHIWFTQRTKIIKPPKRH